MKLPEPSEDEIQISIVEAFGLLSSRAGFMFFHVANEAAMKARSGKDIHGLIEHLKKMGLMPGVSDLVIVFEGRAYFLEIKTSKGKQTKDQIAFELWARDCGAPYRLVKSFDQAITSLEDWGIITD